MRLALLLSALLVGQSPTPPAAPPAAPALRPDDRLAAADLLADLGTLRSALEAIHPGLYRYQTRAEFDARCAALAERWGGGRTVAETFLDLSEFTAAIRCGHTFLNPFNQSKAVRAALLGGKVHLPFSFRWIQGRMIVLVDRSGRALPRGTEVLSIDGVGVGDMRRRFLPMVRADGGNEGKRIALLEGSDAERFPTFDVLRGLCWPSATGTIEAVVRAPGAAETMRVAMDLLTAAERGERITGPGPRDPKEPTWTLDTGDDGIAVLRMDTWAVYNVAWDWKAWLHGQIDGLVARKAPALIIDLRANEGGLDVGDEIISRMVDEPMSMAEAPRYARYRRTPAALNPVLDTWDDSFRDWSKDVVDDHDGFVRFDDKDGGPRRVVPRGPRYHGTVVVLSSATNSSATGQFVQAVRRHGLATVIGSTTGGNQRGINGGAFFFLRLPKSGLEVDLPIIARFPNDERPTGERRPFLSVPDAGGDPDIAVAPSVEAIVQGIDPELEAARRWIRGR